jgi:hypothetical protein
LLNEGHRGGLIIKPYEREKIKIIRVYKIVLILFCKTMDEMHA